MPHAARPDDAAASSPDRPARLDRPVERRAVLKALGSLGLAFVGSGCSGTPMTAAGSDDGTGGADAGNGGDATVDGCQPIPDETAGPYPDKTGMIANATFHRSDITEGKTGLPVTLTLTVVDVAAGCRAVSGASVEIWHCDKDGVYSEYGGQPGVADQTGTTFLRGVQVTGDSGQVTFKTIYPGWYAGRATHIHIQVFPAGSTTASKTTQLAFPETINAAVYGGSSLYTRGENPTTNRSDMVFGDGDEYQLAALAGDVTSGYAAALVIGL